MNFKPTIFFTKTICIRNAVVYEISKTPAAPAKPNNLYVRLRQRIYPKIAGIE
jgi:hypothetical protein